MVDEYLKRTCSTESGRDEGQFFVFFFLLPFMESSLSNNSHGFIFFLTTRRRRTFLTQSKDALRSKSFFFLSSVVDPAINVCYF